MSQMTTNCDYIERRRRSGDTRRAPLGRATP
jgi:hypothetical protein